MTNIASIFKAARYLKIEALEKPMIFKLKILESTAQKENASVCPECPICFDDMK